MGECGVGELVGDLVPRGRSAKGSAWSSGAYNGIGNVRALGSPRWMHLALALLNVRRGAQTCSVDESSRL
jgi:hypothetical protein